jgi:hypothetical protein
MGDISESELSDGSAHSAQPHSPQNVFSETGSVQDGEESHIPDSTSSSPADAIVLRQEDGMRMESVNDADIMLGLVKEGSLFVKDENHLEDIEDQSARAQITSTEDGREPLPRIEVRLPAMPEGRRHEFVETFSQVVELVRDQIDTEDGSTLYQVAFTDGREKQVSL